MEYYIREEKIFPRRDNGVHISGFCETDLKYRSKERNNNNGRDQV